MSTNITHQFDVMFIENSKSLLQIFINTDVSLSILSILDDHAHPEVVFAVSLMVKQFPTYTNGYKYDPSNERYVHRWLCSPWSSFCPTFRPPPQSQPSDGPWSTTQQWSVIYNTTMVRDLHTTIRWSAIYNTTIRWSVIYKTTMVHDLQHNNGLWSTTQQSDGPWSTTQQSDGPWSTTQQWSVIYNTTMVRDLQHNNGPWSTTQQWSMIYNTTMVRDLQHNNGPWSTTQQFIQCSNLIPYINVV